ncbi:hypothetical protein FJY90_03055 [Candidatus Gottesmanbacteria bacterium]|nr:hypothetical protein [Candidatus Gottesmanbacteria bacterium]
MKTNLLFLSILIYTAFSRFWSIDSIPPIINSTVALRVFSAISSIGSVIVILFYFKDLSKRSKIGLLSAWVYSVLPWTLEQGRIVSQPNIALFIFLLALFKVKKIIRISSRIALCFLFLLGLYIVYPQLWLFRTNQLIFPHLDYLRNICTLISADFLFFNNNTFWWGGIKESGVMFISFLPFFIIGIYKLIIQSEWKIFFWLGLIFLISFTSPYFPESREFFLAIPFICYFIAIGIDRFFRFQKNSERIIFLIMLLLIIYDLSQLSHYYFVHYPQQILSNTDKINVSF